MLSLIKVILLLYNKSKLLIKQGFVMNDRKCDEILKDIMHISHYVLNEDFEPIEKLKKNISNESMSLVYKIQRNL